MAKKKRPDDLDDFNFDDDLDLSNELGDIGNDYEMDASSPNTKSREPANKSLKKFGKGFTDAALDTIALENAGKMAKKALPRSLKNEIGELDDLVSGVKDQYQESIKEIKTVGRATVAQLDRIMPTKGMFRNALEKLKSSMGEDDAAYAQADKAAMETETITNALGEIFTENHKAERVQEIVRQSIENKRHKTSTDLLASIASETEQSRKFNFEIANNYFRRSLELNYRHLFIAKEQLEVLKAGITGFKSQFETIVHNTALPDILKYRGTEMVKESLAQNARQQVSDVFFSDANPIMTLKRNLIEKVKQTGNSFKDGLTSSNDMLESMAEANENMQMAGGKSYLLGQYLAEFGRDKILGSIGNKLGRTARGKNAVFNIKTAMADPSAYFGNLSNSDLGDGVIGDMKRGLYSTLSDLSNTNRTNDAVFKREELDSATMFDIRTKDSINKVIPGLLGNIYSEVKGIRTGKFTPDDDAVIYDHHKGVFTTSNTHIDKIKSALKNTIKSKTDYALNSFIEKVVNDGGVDIDDREAKEIQRGIFKYVTDGGSISASALISPKFLSYFSSSTAAKMSRAGSELLSMGRHDPMYLDSLQSDLRSIKESIPNVNKILNNLYARGMGSVGVKLGGMKYNEATETYMYNKEGAKDLLTSLYGDVTRSSKGVYRRDKTEIDQTDVDFQEYLKDMKETILAKGRKTKKVLTPEGLKEVYDNSESVKKAKELRDAAIVKKDEYVKKYQDYDFKAKYSEIKTDATTYLDKQKDEIHEYLKDKYPGIDDVTIDSIYKEGKKKYRELNKEGSKLKKDTIKEFNRLEKEVAKKHKEVTKQLEKEYAKTKKEALKQYGKVKKSVTKKLTSRKFIKLRDQFYSTPEYLSGKMTDLDTWLQTQNYDTTNIKEFNITGMAEDAVGRLKMGKDKVANSEAAGKMSDTYKNTLASVKSKIDGYKNINVDELKSSLAERFGSENIEKAKTLIAKLKVTKRKDEKVAIVEALETMAEENAEVVATIEEKKAKNKKRSRFGKFASKLFDAHSIDSMLLKGGLKGIGTGLKFGVKAPWLAAKYGLKGLGMGYNAYKSEAVQDVLGQTRNLDKAMTKSLPGLLMSGIKLPFTALGLGAKGLYKGGKWLFGNLPDVEENPKKEEKPKKNIFDTDNSGERDGSWKDRLKLFGKKPKAEAKQPTKPEKEEKKGGIWGMFATVLPLIGTALTKLIGLIEGLPGLLLKVLTGPGKLIAKAASAIGTGVVAGGTAAINYGKKALGIGKVAAVGAEVAGAATAAGTAAAKPGKIMAALNSFKSIILKKLGPLAGARMIAVLSAKIAARMVPFAGQALLVYDGAKIAGLMIGGMSFLSAVSTQILGMDLFNDDEAIVDENGEPVKPDENLNIKEPPGSKPNDENKNSGFFSRMKDSMTESLSSGYTKIKEKAIEYKDKAVGAVKSGYDTVKSKVGSLMSGGFNNSALGATKEKILSMLDRVAEKTGVNPNILKTFAAVESGLNPMATVGTSSAAGLFQFLRKTWSTMVSKYGNKYGIDGNTSPFDAEANATMGAEFLKENMKAIQGVRPNPTVTDLYLAHFLGAGGAKQFLSADPATQAASIMPAAAKANPNIFYHKNGMPKTISEIYTDMDNKMYNKAIAFGFEPATSTAIDNTGKTGLDAAKEAAGSVPVVDRKPVNNTGYTPPVISDLGNAEVPVSDTPNKDTSTVKPTTTQNTLSDVKTTTPTVSDTVNTSLVSVVSETNTTLSRIDKTLVMSLETQVRMANALEKIVNNFDKTLDIPKSDQSNASTSNIQNIKSAPANSTLPEPVINISRNMYNTK